MGCTESRRLYAEADVAASKPAPWTVTVPGSKAIKVATTYKLKERIFRLREDYDIIDQEGNVGAKMLGRYVSLRDRQTLADAKGNKALVLIRKVLTFKPAFYFYTFQPNFAGQESTETDDGKKLYKFALLQSTLLSIPPVWKYSLFTTSNADPVEVGTVSAVCNLFYVAATMSDTSGAVLMKYTQKSLFSGGDKQGGAAASAEVEVAAGMDPLQALAICITAPQTLN